MSESREVDITRWMPFHGLDFFEAVKPYPDYIVAGYLRAIWHYWHHTRAEGLPNNQEMLRRKLAQLSLMGTGFSFSVRMTSGIKSEPMLNIGTNFDLLK